MEPTSVAATLYPPSAPINVPATSGPRNATKRAALNTNETPVARTRVGKTSGNQVGIQVYWPSVKKPLMTVTTSSRVMSWTHRNSTGVSTSDSRKYAAVTGLRPNRSAAKPRVM